MSIKGIEKIKIPKKRDKRILHCICDVCNKNFIKKFDRNLLKKQYHFCSKTCTRIAQLKNGLIDKQIVKANIEKFGKPYTSQLSSTKEKQKKTNYAKYGGPSPTSSEEIRKKQIEVSIKKYGAKTSLLNEDVKRKIKNTCLNKYGTEYAIASKKIREKIFATQKEKYGMFFVETDEFKQKYLTTCQKKFGADNVFRNLEVRKKYKKTMIKKYGFDHNFKVPQIREKSYKKIRKISKAEDIFYERLLSYGLKSQNIQRQVFLNGWIIDFYLPKKDLYIEIDGVYWHGLDRPLSEIKKFKTKRDMVIYKKYLRDREQDKWFKANNLVLMRFTDKQIKEESVVKCIFQ